MKTLLTTTVLAIWMLFSNSVHADVVVIVNNDNKIDSFDHRQIVDIYMGRNLYFPDGSLAIRLDHAPDSDTRSAFYNALMGKSVAEINAYWARLLFTGRAAPPHSLANADAILKAVRDNVNAIAYIEESAVDDSVKVIGRVD